MCATRKHVMIIWSSIPFKIQSGYFPHRKINLHVGNQFIGSVIVCLFVLCNGQDEESTLKTRNFQANNSEKTGKLKETHRMSFTIDSNLSQAGKHWWFADSMFCYILADWIVLIADFKEAFISTFKYPTNTKTGHRRSQCDPHGSQKQLVIG